MCVWFFMDHQLQLISVYSVSTDNSPCINGAISLLLKFSLPVSVLPILATISQDPMYHQYLMADQVQGKVHEKLNVHTIRLDVTFCTCAH